MSLVLVRVTSLMTKEHLRNVIGLNKKGLTPASHHYARVMAKWLEVLAGYAGRPNLIMIISETVLQQLKAQRDALSPR